MKRSLLHGVVGLLSVGFTAGIAFGENHHHTTPVPRPQPAMHEAPPPAHEAPERPSHVLPAHVEAPPAVTNRPATHPRLVPVKRLPARPVAPGKKFKVRPGKPGAVTTRPAVHPGKKPGLVSPGRKPSAPRPKLTPMVKNTLKGVGPKLGPKARHALEHALLGVLLTAEEAQCLQNACDDPTISLSHDECWAINTAVESYCPATDVTTATDPGSAAYGLQITQLVDDGSAAAAGLKAGDVILSVAGVQVQTGDDLATALANAGGDVEVVYIDGDSGETLAVDATPQNGGLGVYVDTVQLQEDNG